jgi:hypothetical protein
MIMPDNDHQSSTSTAVGVSGGTGFAGMVLLLPAGTWKSILLILSPTITIAFSALWRIISQEVDARVADWRIKEQKSRADTLYKQLKNDPNASPDAILRAKQTLDALTILQVELAKRRADAIVG